MSSSLKKYISVSLLFLVLQILLFKNVALWSYGFVYLYVGILLLMPLDFPVLVSLLVAFVLGAFVDVFYNTLGMNASACVAMMFSRYYLLKVFAPRTASENQTIPIMNEVGVVYVILYSSILIFIHHTVLFFIENPSLQVFGYTSLKVVLSSVLTLFFYVTIHFLVFNKKQQR